MGFNVTRGNRPRTAGITETRLSATTGLRSKALRLVTTGGQTAQTMATCVLFGHTITSGTSTFVRVNPTNLGGGTWLQGKLPFPATPCITIAYAAAMLHTIKLRVIGLDQFGIPLTDELPAISLNSIGLTSGLYRVWLPKCFSRIDEIQYQVPTAGLVASMSCGLFFTWNPLLESEVFNTTQGAFYALNLNQGIATQMELAGIVGTGNNLFPEVTSLLLWIGTPGPTTIANVPPLTVIPNHGGYSFPGNEAGSGPNGDDAISGVSYKTIVQDPHKIRLTVNQGFPLRALDNTTKLGDQTAGQEGRLYTPPAGANASIPLTIFYELRVQAASRTAQRLVGQPVVP